MNTHKICVNGKEKTIPECFDQIWKPFGGQVVRAPKFDYRVPG